MSIWQQGRWISVIHAWRPCEKKRAWTADAQGAIRCKTGGKGRVEEENQGLSKKFEKLFKENRSEILRVLNCRQGLETGWNLKNTNNSPELQKKSSFRDETGKK